MGRNRKLQASASCHSVGTYSESARDTFSNLPDDIAHRILSFLDFEDISRVGAVSKRCRHFHLSVPVVQFSPNCLPYNKRHQKNLVRLMSSLDRYMFYRGDRMQRFSISWDFFTTEMPRNLSDDHFRVMTWIHNAIRCNVEELKLRFSYSKNNVLSLPPCVFLSQSLRSLSVHLTMGILEAPTISFPDNIHYLKLENFKVVDERLFKWISCSCKCIKELYLSSIQGMQNITIESSSLECFCGWIHEDALHLNISGEKLENIHIHWLGSYQETRTSSNASKSLKIFAPNLKILKWEWKVSNSQNLGKLMSLEKAEILLESEVNEFDNVLEILCSLCSAQVLIINEKTIKALSKEGSMPAPILDNGHNLSVHCESLTDDLVPSVISLLRGMPNLTSTSTWNAKPSSGFGMEYWKLQNLAFIHQLKEVTIEHSHGSNEIEFARYILEHAQNLKKMVILLHHEDEQSKVVEMVSRSKMISTASVIIRRHIHKLDKLR